MSRSLLIYSYAAKNAGDLAITLGALDVLSKTNYDVTTISRYSANDEQFKASSKYFKHRYPEVEILPSPYGLDRETSKFGLLKQYLVGFLKILGIKDNLEFKKIIRDSDIIYFNGGNLLRCDSITDFIRLVALIYPLKIALKAKIPIVILPQSTVSINYWGRKVLKPILNLCENAYCREELSFKILKKYFPQAPIRLNTDMAFYINHGILKSQTKTNRIAITTRSQTLGDLNELPFEKKEHIENQLKQVVSKLIRKGYHISFVVQTKKDLDFTKSIFNFFAKKNSNVSFFENYDPLELLKFYSSCDVLIGMRLHSIILALAVGTSCIGYFEKSWGLKNQGVMEAFNQNFSYIGESSEKLSLIIEKQLKNNVRTNEKNIKDLIKQHQKEFFQINV